MLPLSTAAAPPQWMQTQEEPQKADSGNRAPALTALPGVSHRPPEPHIHADTLLAPDR